MILQKPLTVPFKTKGNVIGRIKTMQLCYKYTWSRLGKRNINRIKISNSAIRQLEGIRLYPLLLVEEREFKAQNDGSNDHNVNCRMLGI